LIKAEGVSSEAIIDLRLCGILNLDRIALDQIAACAEIQRATGGCAVTMDTTGLNVGGTEVAGSTVSPAQSISHEQLEKTAIRNLVETENLWGLEGRQDEFAALFYELKEQVRAGSTGDELADVISQSPLVGLVQKAMEEQASREPRDERDKWKERGESAAKGFDLVVQMAEVQTEG